MKPAPDWRQNRLSDVRVVDLTQVVSGSVATMMIADYGGEVVKVEPPGGEPYRRYGTPASEGGENLNALRFNRNKRSICVDLKTPEGQRLLADLVARSDVLVENFRPGVLARLGFDFERLTALNPDIVYTTVSGYGHDDLLPSPRKHDASYAVLAEATAGLLHLAGAPEGRPTWMGFAMADIFSGVLAFAGTLLALLEVDRGGGAQRVDISMFDASLLMNDLAIDTFETTGRTTGRGQYPLQAPWGAFPTADGYVAIAIMSEREWAGLATAIGRPDLLADARLGTGVGRSEHMDVIDGAVSAWLADLSTSASVDLLRAAGVPCAPVNDAAAAVAHPNVAVREMLVDVTHGRGAAGRIVGNPIKSSIPTRLREPNAIPALGQDSRWVLDDVLGYGPDVIAGLIENGIVRPA